MDAHPRYLIATDAAAFAVGAVLLLLVSLIRSLFSPLAVALLIACLAIGFGIDIGVWFLRGIRSVELEEELLILYRGPSLEIQRVDRGAVSAVTIRSRFGRRGAVLLLGAKHKVRIAEDAFPKEAFTRFLSALGHWL
jgi:hypothetical protein